MKRSSEFKCEFSRRLFACACSPCQSDSEPSADELEEGLGDADSDNPHSRASSLSSISRLGPVGFLFS